MTYYILSLKHSPYKGNAIWWRSDDSGYTMRLEEAGVYTKEQIDANPKYYNNWQSTAAIPVDVVSEKGKKFTAIEFGDALNVANATKSVTTPLLEYAKWTSVDEGYPKI